MKENLDNYYLNLDEPQKSTLLALRSIILSFDDHISETQKYGMPCFLISPKIAKYVSFVKKTGEPYILMAEGNHLDNPELEQGSRSRMKILRINPEADISLQTIKSIFNDAIDLYKKGIVRLK